MTQRIVFRLSDLDDAEGSSDPGEGARITLDEDGLLLALDRAVPQHLRAAAQRGGAKIFDLLPALGPTLWNRIRRKILIGQAVVLQRSDGCAGAFPDVRDFRILPADSGAGFAIVEIRPARKGLDRQLLQKLQNEILEAVATGRPLPSVVHLLCRRAEALAPEVTCSVLRADLDANCLYHLAAPSLPGEILELTAQVPIAPRMGACGTAAFRGVPVEARDIASDPLWESHKDAFLKHGLRACWSSPIKGRDGKVAGTFAFYYREPRGPDALDRQIVEACVNLCAIALDHETAQSRILTLAYRDMQTDLPNRAAFQQRACEILAQSGGMEHGFLALHYIDLDDFKGVNDTLGHVVGDQLLRAVATRLRETCGNDEFVARLGGDEFAVLQFPVAGPRAIDLLAKRLLSGFAQPFEVEHRKIAISASIGIARAPDDSDNFSDLLRRADVALYRAKGAGRANYCLFDEEMGQRLIARRLIEKDVRQALAREEISLHFQPVVHLDSGRTVSFEALARWNAPGRGLVPPSEFIPVAEEIGFIGELGDWILRRACSEAAAWPQEIKIAVNLSPLQLHRGTFTGDVEAILAESGLPPERLEFEITESVPLTENAAMRNTLRDLKRLGISIALDDFGTGYSSLSYLRSFPFDRLKIDLSFIREMQAQPPTKAIVKAVLELARSLGLRTTAEGIETSGQRLWLQAHGCSEGQGYLFGRPMEAASVAAYLASMPKAVPTRQKAATRPGSRRAQLLTPRL